MVTIPIKGGTLEQVTVGTCVVVCLTLLIFIPVAYTADAGNINHEHHRPCRQCYPL